MNEKINIYSLIFILIVTGIVLYKVLFVIWDDRWIINNSCTVRHAKIMSFLNVDGFGGWSSIVHFRYQHLHNTFDTVTSIGTFPVGNSQEGIKILVNNNNPQQFISFNRIFHFGILAILLLPVCLVSSIKKTRMFIKQRQFGGQREND